MTAVCKLLTENIGAWTEAVKSKASAGRGGGSGTELYGVKKLRELILDLAVRGLLIPQDPNDETASELLRRTCDGSGKSVCLSVITNENMPHEIPPSWEWVRFGDIAVIERGGSPRPIKSFITDDPDGLNWIKIGDADQGGKYITSTQEKIRREGLAKTRMVYPGDFLLTNSMSFGRPYITLIEGCIHDGWLRISPPSSIEKNFLYLLLSSPFMFRAFQASAAGAVVMNLNADKVRDVAIPLPPLAEQHRIVAKVDELMLLCDKLEAQQADAIEAHKTLVTTVLDALTKATEKESFDTAWARIAEHFDTLFTTEWSVVQLEKTILQLAVMGKLVPQDSNDQPASELLENMKQAKAHLVKAKQIRKRKALDKIDPSEWPFEIPKGWVYSRLDDIGDWGAGATPDRKASGFYDGDIPWFKSGELKSDLIFDSEEHVTKKALAECSLRLNPVGDVLVAMYGATIGKASILGASATTNQAVCACTVYGEFLNHYLLLILKAYRQRLIQMGAGGAQPNISREKIVAVVVPVPPKAEQHRIVSKVEHLMAICDALKSSIEEAQQTQLLLADAITEQAVA